nr:hypothetical protein [Planctomycetota bacterium]
LFATAAQLERATPLARASFYAAGGQVAAPGQPSTLPIAAAVPGLSMTQASAKLYDAAVAAAANAVPNSEAGSLYGYALGAMMQFRAKLVDRQDMIAALIGEEAMLATYSPFPQDQAARTRLSYNFDRLREISDGLARGLPRLSALLSMPGLSEAVTVPAVPASPKPVKPLTVEQVVAANTGR